MFVDGLSHFAVREQYSCAQCISLRFFQAVCQRPLHILQLTSLISMPTWILPPLFSKVPFWWRQKPALHLPGYVGPTESSLLVLQSAYSACDVQALAGMAACSTVIHSYNHFKHVEAY